MSTEPHALINTSRAQPGTGQRPRAPANANVAGKLSVRPIVELPVKRTPAASARLRATTGATLTEVLVLIGLVGLVAFGGFKLFGSAIEAKILGQAGTVMEVPNCFVAGTPVATPDGTRPIEQVKAGDLVTTRDEATGSVYAARVLKTFVTPSMPVVDVRVSEAPGSVIRATPGHRFWTADRGWIGAGALVPGEALLSASGDRVHVDGAAAAEAATATVYNFEVEGAHTYFVGAARVWVHNPDPASSAGEPCAAIAAGATGGGPPSGGGPGVPTITPGAGSGGGGGGGSTGLTTTTGAPAVVGGGSSGGAGGPAPPGAGPGTVYPPDPTKVPQWPPASLYGPVIAVIPTTGNPPGYDENMPFVDRPEATTTRPAYPIVNAAGPVLDNDGNQRWAPAKTTKIPAVIVPAPGFTFDGKQYYGGGPFENTARLLPTVDAKGDPITYREWDVNPYNPPTRNGGAGRGNDRVVTSSDGHVYYTNEHYRSFTQLN